jgi:hypothetical protein
MRVQSCGICKELLKELSSLCIECQNAKAGAIFLRHDVMDEFDSPSDVARLYGVRSVPRIFFMVDGAVVSVEGGIRSGGWCIGERGRGDKEWWMMHW